MDTDKVKVFGARFKVDGTGKLAELERSERVSFSTCFTNTTNQFTGENESEGGRDSCPWD